MIAVIADDFTGAAELGGVAIRNGFSVKIDTQIRENYNTEVVIISTNTRSMQPETAREYIKETTAKLLDLQPILVYKKIDSLLRGNVKEELLAQLEMMRKKKAVIIPANPSLNRTIRKGIYYIGDTPLAESPSFSKAVGGKSSHVYDLLDSNREVVSLCNPEDLLPSGLIIGNTYNEEDLKKWASRIDGESIPAGGSNFFNAILKKYEPRNAPKNRKFSPGKKALYICGSKFGPSVAAVKRAKENGHEVLYMPSNIFCPEKTQSLLETWRETIIDKMESRDKVILGIDKLTCKKDNLSKELENLFSLLVQQILENKTFDELIIEGGATAYSVINTLGYTEFWPQQELSQGVIRMTVEGADNPAITLKPGSYKWPESIWSF